MRKIRKFIFFVLVVGLISSFSCTSAIAATLDNNNTTGSATVVYKSGQTINDNGTPDDPTDDTVGGTYTVSIPDFIEVAEVNGTPAEYEITARDVLIPYNTALTVGVSFSNKLLLADNAAVSVGYDLKANPQKEGALVSVNSGDTVLTVNAGNPDAVTTSSIAASLTEAPVYSGTYSNTATFNINVA